jgi:hypothetical protein
MNTYKGTIGPSTEGCTFVAAQTMVHSQLNDWSGKAEDAKGEGNTHPEQHKVTAIRRDTTTLPIPLYRRPSPQQKTPE